MNNVVWRLLKRNISKWQILAYVIANIAGLAIILTAVQFYNDTLGATAGNSSCDYLVVSKSIGIFDRNTIFKPSEIENLREQPWVEDVGAFEASRFRVSVSVDFRGYSMSTETFFEAIPAKFYDHLPDDWTFDPDKPQVPIILSRDYLSLYNFGFASSRGLPKLRDSEISMIPLEITVAGNGKMTRLKGYIAGFSSRISTIAVPLEFMTWANNNYGSSTDRGSSRLVVEVNDPGNPAIKQYMEHNNLEVSGDKFDNSETSFIMKLIITIVAVIGLVITLLAILIVTLSIYLLLTKNRERINRLKMLGYHSKEIARYYQRPLAIINLGILVISIIIVMSIRQFWVVPLKALDMQPGNVLPTIFIALLLYILITMLNMITIRACIKTKRLFNSSY